MSAFERQPNSVLNGLHKWHYIYKKQFNNLAQPGTEGGTINKLLNTCGVKSLDRD